MCFLESRRYREPEGLAWLQKPIPCSVSSRHLAVGVVARAARREHTAGNQLAGTAVLVASQSKVAVRLLIQPQRVVGIVDAEGRIDDRHDDRQLYAGGHARNEVGAGDGVDVAQEARSEERRV